MMVGLEQTIQGHATWFDYHIEALSGPPEEIDKNMVDKNGMILMREKTNMYVLTNIRSFNNQGALSCLLVLIIDMNELTTHFWSLPRSLGVI